MKKIISLALICMMFACMLSGCTGDGASNASPTAEPTQQAVFVPQTTAVATSGLASVLASVSDDEEADAELEKAQKALTDMIGVTQTAVPQQAAQDIPAATNAPVQDAPAEDVPAEETGSDEPAAQPTATPVPEVTPEPRVTQNPAEVFATSTPQPNTIISGYSTISNTGLGFQFSYPSGWQNVPGRSTVCFIQPVTDGTLYPARVSVSMKQLPHKCNDQRLQEQMAEFAKSVMSQYDQKTFEIEEKLDTQTSFMGNRKTLATTYLAYDGEQEIAGYFIMTYFEKYVFCFHFLSAYEDFDAFSNAMRHMRDSVSAEAMPEAAE